MYEGKYRIPKPINEPILGYLPGSREKKELKEKLLELKNEKITIPIIIDGKEITTEKTANSVVPHNHQHILAEYYQAGAEEVKLAIKAALNAKKVWNEINWFDRASIFLKAAELLAGPFRSTINAATMLDVSKNVYQAEIDSACELIDMLRFNAYFMQEIYENQPISARGQWNRLTYRPLEGFVLAITPFNFVSIAGNLPSAPAMMGNTIIWKPASSAVYAAYYVMRLFEEAGLPSGVINFIPGSGSLLGKDILLHPDLAGVHFTGSTGTFQWIWKTIGENIAKYRSYPRIVGETGGKDFVVAHSSANSEEVATALIRGAFEYQGQKCSAASRAYIPESMWEDVIGRMKDAIEEFQIGDVEDFRIFMNAVIDKSAFKSIVEFIEYTKTSSDAEIITGGTYDDTIGYFIDPTIIKTTNPKFKTMEEEIFGPVLTCYVYPDNEFEAILKLCDETSPFALTGAIFAKDRKAIVQADRILINAAGNFYINDKPTGAVIGQQPFGGARASGTNDKAGSYLNLLRWASPRTTKENFVPPRDYKYPFMVEE